MDDSAKGTTRRDVIGLGIPALVGGAVATVGVSSMHAADEGLPALYSLNGLDFVGFQDNKGVTKEAVAKFKKAVPGSRPVGGN